jgi:hypothetical protein
MNKSKKKTTVQEEAIKSGYENEQKLLNLLLSKVKTGNK